MKTLGIVAVIVALTGCATSRTADIAIADLRDVTGRTVGKATLTSVAKGVQVVVDVSGLPGGERGVHIHDVGRCEPPTFESAGPHFNPGGKQHGTANPQGPHAGDLPNLVVDANGRGRLEAVSERFTLGSGPTSLFDANGSALVVHASPDDYRTDPTGNSGGRAACGVLVRSRSASSSLDSPRY